jgi:tetratricopeptide (TPR) repeat protein
VREVAGLLGLTEGQIRGYVRAGFLDPERGPRGELRFAFRDLSLLRLVKGLASSRVPPRRLHRALRLLREQLPETHPLSGLHLLAEGDELVARRDGERWNPESGQRLFDFDPDAQDRAVVELLRPVVEDRVPLELHMSASDWYALGCELHERDPDQARGAYLRALELDPGTVDARVNLGCCYHATGKLSEAEAQYRAALEQRSDDAVTWFNLGVVLEDQMRLEPARRAYEQALELESECADAHYNLARLCDRAGDPAGALRHLRAYRNLTQGR